jgi:hypothetical protein
LLVGIVFKKFLFVPATTFALVFFLHPAFIAGFGLAMADAPVCQLSHAVMHLQAGTCGSTEVQKG